MPDNFSGGGQCLAHFSRLCDFGGRLCGSQGERRALDYARRHLGSLPGGALKIHDVEYPGWQVDNAQLGVDQATYPAIALPGCGSCPAGGVELPLLDCGRGTPEQLKNHAGNISGHAVIVSHEYMFAADHVHRSRKFDAAATLGAAAFIVTNPWHDSGLVSGGVSSELPAFGVSKHTGDALRQIAGAGGSARLTLDCRHRAALTQTLDWKISPARGAINSGDEIIICAHIDGHSPSQSAIDNASGVAVALALASRLSGDRSWTKVLRILIFSAEELNLTGSGQYVDSLSTEKKNRILAVLNLDCVGGSTSLCAMTSGFDSLKKLVLNSAEISGIPVNIYEPLVPNSDHYNFARAGIPALRLIAGFNEKKSRLRHVLTSADSQDLVTGSELENALSVIQIMIRILSQSPVRRSQVPDKD